jgi:hypothetical protein
MGLGLTLPRPCSARCRARSIYIRSFSSFNGSASEKKLTPEKEGAFQVLEFISGISASASPFWEASRNTAKFFHHIFFHPDFTVGFGIAPNPVLAFAARPCACALADYTAGREFHPALKTSSLNSVVNQYHSTVISKLQDFSREKI